MVDRDRWLTENSLFSALSPPARQALATALTEVKFAANRRLILEDSQPKQLIILRKGQLEAYRTRLLGPAELTLLGPGAVLGLRSLLLDQPNPRTVNSETDCILWQLDGDRLLALAEAYPEFRDLVSQDMAAELASLSAQLAYEKDRQQALRSYEVSRVRRGVIGRSRYAQRLRQNVRDASQAVIDPNTKRRSPLVITGEPGLNKDNLAALIHFGSGNRRNPMIRVDCQTLRPQDLFGRDEQPGLLDWLGEGTLLLNNLQDLPNAFLPAISQLIGSGTYQSQTQIKQSRPTIQQPQPTPAAQPSASLRPNSQASASQGLISQNQATTKTAPIEHSNGLRTSRAWIMVVAERSLPEVTSLIPTQIKVPPLRVRKADIKAQINYYLALQCRSCGEQRPQVTLEALRSLQGYDFPGNLTELDNLLERAMRQREANAPLTEDIFWSTGSKKQRFRFNLLNADPTLRQFLRSPAWPDRLNYGFTAPTYAIVVALLFFGPQTRDHNFALNLFWAWWWPLILLSFPFVGRLWCSVCPFMIYGEITQWLRQKLWPGSLLPWPRKWADRWGGWILFGGFAAILLWEELWNLENTAYLSAWLLVIITAGAMICSALFERRFWCRYLCPIGGMNGLFAKLAMTELRAQQGICAASCNTYQCYKGGPALGEGQKTNGCPLYSHPAQLNDNRNCVLCMTCLQACPHRSIAVNLRPPGIELWTSHLPLSYEVALLFLLLGAVPLHHLPELVQVLGFSTDVLTRFGVHAGWSVVALVLPGAIALLTQTLIQLLPHLLKAIQPNLCRPRSFTQLAYGYLPLVLAANLAHYLNLGLAEAGQIWPVTLATFGFSGSNSMTWVADPAVITFLQGTTLLSGLLLSIVLTQKIAMQRLGQLWPQHLGAIAITASIWQLIETSL